jgi:glycosyltransferase involved in cell wall biosynthesis
MGSTMTSPLFSVIVPTYGRPRFLAEAVASVMAQTVEDFECIVVDDASPDPPSVPDDPRVRVVRRERNDGPAAARNTGLDYACGRFVAFLDDDDLYTPDRLALAVDGLARAPVATCWNGYLRTSSRRRKIKRNRLLEGRVEDVVLDQIPPHLGVTALWRDVAVRFDERFSAIEDVEWWLRLAQRATVATVPKVGYIFRKHAGPRHRTDLQAHVRGSLLALELHEPYFRSHPVAAAFRYKRLGIAASRLGDRALARAAFARSLRLDPGPAALWHLARSVGPSSVHVELHGLAHVGRQR